MEWHINRAADWPACCFLEARMHISILCVYLDQRRKGTCEGGGGRRNLLLKNTAKQQLKLKSFQQYPPEDDAGSNKWEIMIE